MKFIVEHPLSDNYDLLNDIDNEIEEFINDFEFSGKDLNDFIEEFYSFANESLTTRIIGGLTGLAAGKAVGRFIIKFFKINQDSVLYKLLTSRLFFLAVGAAIGKDKEEVANQDTNQSPK